MHLHFAKKLEAFGFPMKSQDFSHFCQFGTFTIFQKQPQHKGRGGKKKGKRKILPKHTT